MAQPLAHGIAGLITTRPSALATSARARSATMKASQSGTPVYLQSYGEL